MEYIGIYNASSTISGEFLYVLGKLFKQTECSLCDISHGLSFKAKDSWKQELDKFPYKFTALHTNEIPVQIQQQLNDFPVVIALQDDQSFTVIMNKAEIKSCHKEPALFFQKLQAKIDQI